MALKTEKTNTTRFLLPCFGIHISKYFELGFINAYLSDKNREKINDKDIHIYLLFKPNNKQLKLLQETIEKLEEHNNLILEDYDYENNYVVIVFKLPERFKNDYNLYIEGKYSQLSDTITQYYPEEITINYSNGEATGKSLEWMACNKSPKLKAYLEKKYNIDMTDSQEYWSIPGPEEVLDISLLLSKEKEII